jgi:signal peptide peptidase SppA
MKGNLAVLTDKWAITEDSLETIAHELKAGTFEFSSGHSSDVDLDIRNGVAVVRVMGTLWRFAYDRIRREVAAAVDDHSVKAVVLRVSSPGGLVSGCKELADFIHAAGQKKHIYAYADGQMCSAAYWIGSAAKDIAAPVTAYIGSIGVRTLHVDWSKWDEQAGLKFTHLAAGEYKALGNEDEPLSKKARDYFQGHLDDLYSIFVDSVARQRGVDRDKALSMADGKVFLADEAQELGLVDRVEQDFHSYLSFILKKEKIMDLATLEKDHPDLYAQALNKGKEEAAEETDQKVKGAVAAETERVLGLAGAVMGADGAEKFTALVNSGATPEMAASMKDVFSGSGGGDGADTSSRAAILAGLESAHVEGLNTVTGKESGKDGGLEAKAKEFADLANS